MMMNDIIAQYGALGVMAVLLVAVIKWVLTYLDRITCEFNEIVKNHIHQNTITLQELRAVLERLERAFQEERFYKKPQKGGFDV